MSSRIRFATARQVFDSFPTAASSIEKQPGDETPIAFARELLRSERPSDAVTFCACLLPRREAVWWGAQCVRALEASASADPALQAAEAWVRDPEEETRHAAFEIAQAAHRAAASTWLAIGAWWSGGNIGQKGAPPFAAPTHLTASAVKSAIFLALARSKIADQKTLVAACAEAGIRFAEGGDAKVRGLW